LVQTYLAIGYHMEVSPLSRWGDRCIPYPTHYRPAFAFSMILYPHGQQSISQPILSDEPDAHTGLPCSVQRARIRRVPPIRRWSYVSVSAPSRRIADHMPFWPEPDTSSHRWLFMLHDVCGGSRYANPLIQPSASRECDSRAHADPSRDLHTHRGGYIVGALSTGPLPAPHCT